MRRLRGFPLRLAPAAVCCWLSAVWLVSCDGSSESDTPLEVSRVADGLIPRGMGECVLADSLEHSQENPEAQHTGPDPGEYVYGPHFPHSEPQSLEQPPHCSGYYFDETVDFEIIFTSIHDSLQWQYQYMNADGYLIGSRTRVGDLFQFPGDVGGGTDTATFSIDLNSSSAHKYLLVWAILDGSDEETHNWAIKLERSPFAPPPPPPDPVSVEIVGPQWVPENETCDWTSVVGETGSYSYSWKKDSQQIGTSANVSTYTGTSNFLLRVDVSGGGIGWDTVTVIPIATLTSCPGV